MYPLLVDTALYSNGTAMTDIAADRQLHAAALVLPPPAFPGAGTYNTPQTVTVTCAVSGTDVHYTTNGVDPTESDPVVACGGTSSVGQSLTLKVRGWKTGFTPSVVRPRSTRWSWERRACHRARKLRGRADGHALDRHRRGHDPLHDEWPRPHPHRPVRHVGERGSHAGPEGQGHEDGLDRQHSRAGTYVVTLGTVATPSLRPRAAAIPHPRRSRCPARPAGP